MDESKLDLESREQLRIIAIEASIEEVKKTFFDMLSTLKNRVNILEEARQRQISLNDELDKRIGKFPILTFTDKPDDKPKWRWW